MVPASAIGAVARTLLALAVLVLAGCASTQHYDRIDERLRAGDAAGALEAASALDTSRNQALYLMNRGMLLRVDGQLEASVDAFEEAKGVLGALEPISISESVAEWTFAETTGAYQASVHERVLLHVMQMLNFLELGRTDAARVEALQVDLGLRRVDPIDGAAPHGGDAFARYLSGIVFEASGDRSDALIAYRRAAQRYEALGRPVPRDLQVSLVRMLDALDLPDERDRWAERFGMASWQPRPEGHGQLLVVLHSGLAPRLRERTVATQDPRSGQLYRVSLPTLQRRGDPVRAVSLSTDEQRVDGERVEVVSDLVDDWLAARMPLLTARAISRNVARHQVAGQARDESQALGAPVNILGFLFEQADTRLWRTLPDSFWMVRVDLPPGEYAPELITGGAGGERRQALEEPVIIRAGGLTVRSVYRH